MSTSSGSKTKMNWSKIARQPSLPLQPTPSQSQPSSKPKNKRKRNRNVPSVVQKSQLPRKNGPNSQSQSSQISFAALTAKTKSFAAPPSQYQDFPQSAPSSHQNDNAIPKDSAYAQIKKEELRRRDEQRQSALHELKNGWSNGSVFSNYTVYGVRNRGIVNRNVDCYINAIIQSLLSLPLFVTIFSEIKSSKTATQIGPFTRALFDVVAMFSVTPSKPSKSSKSTPNNGKKKKWNQNNHNEHGSNEKKEESLNDSIHSNIRHPLTLIEILDKFRRSVGRLGNGQQDAQEFLGYIIANLHDEMTWNSTHRNANGSLTSSVSSCTNISKHKNQRNESNDEYKEDGLNGNGNGITSNLNGTNSMNTDNTENQKGWTLVTKNVHRKSTVAHRLRMKQSLMSTLFGGEYYQMIRRKSKRTKASVSYQPFFSISLDINEHRTRSVHQALQSQFCMQHEVEYKGGTAKKSELISEPPFYLILHLKRFLFAEGEMYKLNKYISYDVTLTVPPHILFDKSKMKAGGNGSKMRYQLRSVLVHTGDFVTHGHYTTYCRREDFYLHQQHDGKKRKRQHQWFMFDDSNVHKVDIKTVTSQQAYVLIYQKVSR